MRLDQTSSDSQCSPTDEFSSKATDLMGTIESSPADTPDAAQPIDVDHSKAFERAGIQINFNDDEISVDVSHTTGLRKTGYSDDLYSDDLTIAKKSISKIPRSPMTRRKSVDSSLSNENTTGLPLGSRKMPVYRSVRKTSPSHTATDPSSSPKHITPTKTADTGTWSGRSMSSPKRRPSIGSESFQPLAPRSRSGSATNLSQGKTFQRNTETRSSRCQYDQNGRRIIKSTNTSPVKQNSSPLAQQILEAAESAKNDSQMLEKMKLLLSKYTVTPRSNGKTLSRSRSSASPSPIKHKEEFEDFTTAWVNSNGSLDRASNCCTSPKVHSKRSSAGSSCDSSAYKGDFMVSARRERGISRIPAPIRQNTELY